MHKTAALAVEETDFALGDLRAEIQASLALNRAVLQALSTLSASMAAAAEGALDDELQLARHAGLSPRVVELLEDARESLRDEDDARMSGLEFALLAAADALPDLRPRHEA
ncbi:hypothetical protein [Phenylobacterium sp.]|uniref:hypothetical protein n=1 Tax=Phenylobacterium sp. TaxID=1871053 RepID=UPI0025D67AF3|nr:hypothetical protein [Phenylobacterium sp.]